MARKGKKPPALSLKKKEGKEPNWRRKEGRGGIKEKKEKNGGSTGKKRAPERREKDTVSLMKRGKNTEKKESERRGGANLR